jgi:integrase
MGDRSSGVRREIRGGKPHWVIDFRYLDKHGRRQRFRRDASLQTAAGARAEAERLSVLVQGNGTAEPTPTVPTFATFVTSVFTPFYAVSKCRPATRERYAALLKQGLLAHFGEKRLDEIGPGDFRMYAAGLAARGIGARAHLSLARTILRAALEFGAIPKLPELPKLPKVGKKLPDAPEADVIVMLLGNAKGWLRVAIALAAYAGLRSGEVRALEVRDVDLKRNELHVRRAFSAGEVLTPKSGDERLVPIAPPLRDILVEAARDKLPHARLVVRPDGATPSRQKVLRSLQDLETRIAKTKEMQVWSFHQLRHSFCSTLVRNGVSVEAVRVLAGHADLKTTQRYVHASAADLKAAVLTLAR